MNPALTTTELYPDMIVETKDELIIIELMVLNETNIDARHIFKHNKYAHFITDIKQKKASLLCYEIGARGYITESNKGTIKSILKYTKCKTPIKTVFKHLSEIVFTASYTLFCQRKNATWPDIPLLSVTK